MPRPRYSIRNQLLLLAVLATGSIWVGALLQYRQLRGQEAFLHGVQANLTASRLYAEAVRHAARERGLSNGWLLNAAGPGGTLPPPLAQERDALNSAMEALARGPQGRGPAGVETRRVRADIEYARTLVNNRAVAPAVIFAGYTRLIATVQTQAARELAEGMRAVNLPYEHVNHINQAVEELAQLRGLTFGVLGHRRLEDGQKLDIARQLTLYREYMRLYRETRPPYVALLETRRFDAAKVERVLAVVQAVLTAPTLPAVDWWPLATAGVDELQGLAERESAQLAGMAGERIAGIEHRLRTTVAVLVLLGLVTLVLVLVTVSRVVRGLGALLGGLEDVAERGNFDTRLAVDRRDEFGTIGAGVNRLIALAADAVDARERDSREDALTGVLNRRGLDDALQARGGRRADARPFSLLLLDVDHFKRVNDDFGHPAGDRVLVGLAGLLRRHLRPGDSLGRYGGEEFMVLLDGCALADATRIAETLRRAVAGHDFALVRAVTVSVGVAEQAAHETTAALVGRADRALYKAKAHGRNQVVGTP